MRYKNQLFVHFVFISLLLSFSVCLYGQEHHTDSISGKRYQFSVYPAITYSPETSVKLGAMGMFVFNQQQSSQDSSHFYRPSSITPYFLYTLKNQVLIVGKFDLFLSNKMNISGKTGFFNFPEYFYGIGNGNTESKRELYGNRYFLCTGKILKSLNEKWSAGLNYDIQSNRLDKFDADGELISGEYTGINGGWNTGIGPSIRYDTRDNVLFPGKGSLAWLEVTFFSELTGSDYHYTSWLLDVRKYIHIGSPKHILAFQGYANFTSGDKIPFYKLPKLGGDERLRGIADENLYCDNQVFWMQAEYRRELFWRFGGVVWVGTGEVAPAVGDFCMNKLKMVAGVGGRFCALKEEKLNVRLDIGLAGEGQMAVYFSIREAF